MKKTTYSLLILSCLFFGSVNGWNTLAMPNASGADPVPLRNQDYVFAVGMYF